MLGNDTNKAFIKNALDDKKVPHTLLFTGDAGCGKTTAARILALGLNCDENGEGSSPCLKCRSCKSILNSNSIDVKEVNVGQSGGKDHIDALVRDLPMAPFNSNYKVIILDEAHKLTDAAKDLLLKPLEDGFDHVYFVLCTNNPEKLKSKKGSEGEAFLDRCTTLDFGRVDLEEIAGLIKNVCEYEGYIYNQDVLDVITEASKGVPRNALRWLNQIAIEGSWQLKAAKQICSSAGTAEDDPQVIELSRALIKPSFSDAVKIFGGIKKIPVESVRIGVAGFFVGCLKRSRTFGEARKFSKALDVLTIPIYEQGKLAEHKWYNYMYKVVDAIAAGRVAERR
jgi:DNA polymerase III subunit gamma/tau